MFSKFFKWCSGRHTGFAVYFALMGTTLAWFHRLDLNYVALIGAIQSLVLGHSIKEDYVAMKQAETPAPAPVDKGADNGTE